MTQRATHSVIILLLLAGEAAYLALFSEWSSKIGLFVVVSIVASVGYLLVCLIMWRSGALPRWMLWAFLAAGLAYRMTAIGIGPIASGDAYRYLWEGKVIAAGYNPYAIAPTDPALQHLHSAILPGTLEFADKPTIYPPFTEWVFTASYLLFGEQVIGIKLFLLLAECLTAVLLLLVLKALAKPLHYAAFYLLCPLPILQFMTEGHCDGLAFPAFLLALLFWIHKRELAAYAALGAAILFKLLPLLLVPVLWREAQGRRKWLAVGIPVLLTVLVYAPYLLGGLHAFQSVVAYSSRWYFNGIIFDGVLALTGSNEGVHIFMMVLFAAWFTIVLTRPMDLLSRVFWVFMGFFILSPTVHPWYITWLAVLLPLYFTWSGTLWLATVSIANIVYINYLSRRLWHLPVGLEILEYAPVFVLLWIEVGQLLRSKTSTR